MGPEAGVVERLVEVVVPSGPVTVTVPVELAFVNDDAAVPMLVTLDVTVPVSVTVTVTEVKVPRLVSNVLNVTRVENGVLDGP